MRFDKQHLPNIEPKQTEENSGSAVKKTSTWAAPVNPFHQHATQVTESHHSASPRRKTLTEINTLE